MKNKVTCLTCLTTIESTYRHEFVRCKCKDNDTMICVDGGKDYCRRVWGKKARWEEADGTIHEPEESI